LKKVETDLNSLLWKDTVLQDLADKHLTTESVEALLAFEAGQGICINLKRDDGSTLPINIKKNETILGLKKRIRTETERELKCHQLELRRVNINWKHIWRLNWLITSDKEKLTDDRVLLKDARLTNNSEIKFLKKFREKQKRKGSKRRQAVEKKCPHELIM
jgi:hypothetical protein